VHGLPDDYHAGLHADLLSAHPEQVSAAAAAHLRSEGLTLVVEGDADAIRDGLVETGLGEVVEVEI